MSRPLALLMLISTTMLWGFAFVAQKSAMDGMGPLTFAGVRYVLGASVLLPVALWELRRRRERGGVALTRRQWWLIGVLCVVFFLGSILQQWGLTATTVTNGGFLTGLYAFFTPLFGWRLFRTRPHPIVIVSVPLALLGLFYLNGGGLDPLGFGDMLVILCALFWGLHVLLLGSVSLETGMPITISVGTFAFAGIVSVVLAPVLEAPTLEAIMSGWVEILYAGILSTAVAFTFQAIAQQYVPPANVALVLASEGLFAALGGALLLGERLPPVGYFGAGLLLLSIVLVEVVPALLARNKTLAPIS